MQRLIRNTYIQLNSISIYRDAIYGFAILYIVFFHAFAIDGVDYSFGNNNMRHFQTIMNNGNVGVDIFLFLSGVFLYYSFQKRSLQEFVRKRITRLMVPLFIVNGGYWLIRFAILNGNILDFLSRITAIRFFITGDSSIWFVSVIFFFYILYPWIYAIIYEDNQTKSIILRTLGLMAFSCFAVYSLMKLNRDLYDMVEVGFTRLPVFIFGCGMGKFVYEQKNCSCTFVIPTITTFLFFSALHFDILHDCYRRWLYILGGVSLTFLLTYLFQVIDGKNSMFTWLIGRLSNIGKFSLELYLSHITINQIYRLTDYYIAGDFWRYCIVVIIPSVIIAFLVSALSTTIIRGIEKNK